MMRISGICLNTIVILLTIVWCSNAETTSNKLDVKTFLSQQPSRSISCDIMQRWTMAAQWRRVWRQLDKRFFVCVEVWRRLFEAHPEVIDTHFTSVQGHDLFSGRFRFFAWKSFVGLHSVLLALPNERALQERFTYIGRIHKQYPHIEPLYYHAFLTSLIDTAEYVLGGHINKAAWWQCGLLAMEGMQHIH